MLEGSPRDVERGSGSIFSSATAGGSRGSALSSCSGAQGEGVGPQVMQRSRGSCGPPSVFTDFAIHRDLQNVSSTSGKGSPV